MSANARSHFDFAELAKESFRKDSSEASALSALMEGLDANSTVGARHVSVLKRIFPPYSALGKTLRLFVPRG